MKTIDIARRAWRSLRNAKARTILTSLAIAVGSFTIAISLAAGEGARQYADKLISANVNPRALFVVKDDALFEGGAQQSGLSEYDPDATLTRTGVSIQRLTQADVDTLANRSDLEYVVPTYSPKVKYVSFGEADMKFTAEVQAYDPTVSSELSWGTLPTKGEQLAEGQTLIPESFLAVLKDKKIITSDEQAIGLTLVMTVAQSVSNVSADQIAAALAQGGQTAVQALTTTKTKEFTFTVSGVAKRSATALTGSTAVLVSSNTARQMSEYETEGTESYQKYIAVTALAKEGVDPEVAKQGIADAGFAAQTAKDLQGVIFTVVNTLQGIVLGFGVVALIASVFGIINTQYISVLERTREIGLMKALGMRGRSVSRLFQFEAAWIGFLGGIIGSAIAVLAGSMLNPWITDMLDLGEGTYLLIFQIVPISLMILGLVLIAMLAGWFPARKAAKLDPIEALRTE